MADPFRVTKLSRVCTNGMASPISAFYSSAINSLKKMESTSRTLLPSREALPSHLLLHRSRLCCRRCRRFLRLLELRGNFDRLFRRHSKLFVFFRDRIPVPFVGPLRGLVDRASFRVYAFHLLPRLLRVRGSLDPNDFPCVYARREDNTREWFAENYIAYTVGYVVSVNTPKRLRSGVAFASSSTR